MERPTLPFDFTSSDTESQIQGHSDHEGFQHIMKRRWFWACIAVGTKGSHNYGESSGNVRFDLKLLTEKLNSKATYFLSIYILERGS